MKYNLVFGVNVRMRMDLEKDADKLIVDYQTGMRKKTALGAAIIHSPRVLFLDEPFEGIDTISGRAIRAVLQQLRTWGATIFFSSHILEVVERLATRIAVIAGGKMLCKTCWPTRCVTRRREHHNSSGKGRGAAAGDPVEVLIGDDGSGIEPEHLEHVFDLSTAPIARAVAIAAAPAWG